MKYKKAVKVIVPNKKPVVFKKYKSTQNELFQVASCSKFITSIIVAMLFQQGKLSYDEDIRKYLKHWKCPQAGVTLRMLLSHTSGIAGDLDGVPFGFFSTNMAIKQNIKLNRDILVGKFGNMPPKFVAKPGKKFEYSNVGFQVVQQVIEDITGKPLFKLMEKMIFKPLGMKNSTGELLYPGKHNYKLANKVDEYCAIPITAAGGVWMSCGDFKILALDFIAGLNDDASKLLRQKTIKDMCKKQKNSVDYGLGVMLYKLGKTNAIGHGGKAVGTKTVFHYVPKTNKLEIMMFHFDARKPKTLPDKVGFFMGKKD